MKRTKIETGEYDLLIIGCIMSDEFIKKLKHFYDPEYVESREVKIVVNWCLEYYAKYKKTPQKHIKEVFEEKTATMNEERANAIKHILVRLSNNFKEEASVNSDYLIDVVKKKFKGTSIQHLSEDLSLLYEQGKFEEASAMIKEFKTVTEVPDNIINVFQSKENMLNAINEEQAEPILRMGGEFGAMVDQFFHREALVGVQAPAKRGKSWFLVHLLKVALANKLKVAFFQCGDMSENQFLRRFVTVMNHKPIKETMDRDVHLDCMNNQCNTCKFSMSNNTQIRKDAKTSIDYPVPSDYVPCTQCLGEEDFIPSSVIVEKEEMMCVSEEDVERIYKVFNSYYKDSEFFLATYHTGELTVEKAENVLDKLRDESNFIPDVIIYDYADIMDYEDGIKDPKEIHNARWKALRRQSLNRHCLTVIPTQSSATAYDTVSQSLNDFSNDRRKLDHTTALLALNQTNDEKANNLMRIQLLASREGTWDLNEEICLLQDLTFGKYNINSLRVKPNRENKGRQK